VQLHGKGGTITVQRRLSTDTENIAAGGSAVD
jgi:hypothetical protein